MSEAKGHHVKIVAPSERATDQRGVARERLGLEVDEIDRGHMVAMSNASELADHLQAYRRDLHNG